ncbi:TackOD1 domain-containing metal-binding protein [Legionella spiritensis]|uniref:Thaumarchaeal output domain-containing protein n=1 Tax=Legionella spiritensis TaxID=452 RepID=A0A0W0YXK1_LEGSP|nr:hypothetical protein [Legionella spiritensis]KTD61586.1 hypothetical protein Lspi_2216 [Legionella spiritensis]SNV32312.1 Uncharacterised protein [Legionella spiritensis]
MKQQTFWIVGNNLPDLASSANCKHVDSIKKLPKQGVFAIIISRTKEHDYLKDLAELRAIKEYRYTPVFYEGTLREDWCELFDGAVNEDSVDNAERIHQQLGMVTEANRCGDSKEIILLIYLFSRPDFKIKGRVNYHATHIFEYPLLTLLFPRESDFDGWRFLQDLVMPDLLTPGPLLDEIQTCSACDSGLLNIKNSCPSCHSINIKPQKFVHCYTCGKIGPVPEFLRQERLVCSRCNTRLRTLGVDYDKPMEDKLCNDCGHYFAEPEVNLVCLVCHRTSSSRDLTSRRLYEYTLSRRGEYLVRGIEKGIYRNFSHFFRVIDYAAFMSIVAWQAKLAERYPSLYFSVMTLQITNADQLLNELGLVDTEKLLGKLFTNLRKVFRESDLSSRNEGTMLFFLPMADEEGCTILVDRIKLFVNQLAANNSNKGLAVGLSYITSTEMINAQLEGELVISELHARIIESNVCLVGCK